MEEKHSCIAFVGPSGVGKTSLVEFLREELRKNFNMETSFSVSATDRALRTGEIDGVHYHFFSPEKFSQYVRENKFLEWAITGSGSRYGTLRSEVEQKLRDSTLFFDLNYRGGLSLKKSLEDNIFVIFVSVSNPESEIPKRLKKRGTETSEQIAVRVENALKELVHQDEFDLMILNDDWSVSSEMALNQVEKFLCLHSQL